jgi:hypothetical protein
VAQARDLALIDDALWSVVSQRLTEHLDAGRGHLLTEDVMRFATVLELEQRGIAADRMRPEYPVPAVGGKIDLVIDDPPTAAIEFKFPRDSRTGISPDTMTLGELLKDFYRLTYLQIPDCWVVQMINDRMRRFLDRRTELEWVWNRGETLVFPADLIQCLPATAQRVFSGCNWLADRPVPITCAGSFSSAGWTLAAYQVERPRS